MKISYNWLCKYLPIRIEPEKLSRILTSIGLEVESLEKYESIKGGMHSLLIGEIMECEKHPNADKLKITKVNIGGKELLQIVCGAPNASAGQKVVVAPVGATIYPINGEPIAMKIAKIRNVESYGMICAQDEIGIGTSHDGIIVLNNEAKPGTPAADYFNVYNDWVYEIGLTPNRMDAMSHLGVARDVCAYLSHHENNQDKLVSPFKNGGKVSATHKEISVEIKNPEACSRYSGALIKNITIKESPQWLKDSLLAIGQRPINNIVDITNFILHESGQPLHAFDADEIKGNKIIVKKLPENTVFISLDEKERKLNSEDLMICNGNDEPMCIGGVFGGLHSGVSEKTKNIFLESAWFNPVNIRRSSIRHNLRTEAATHFEKGVDISSTITVLKRAVAMIIEIAGGELNGDLIDVYPSPQEKKQVGIRYHFIKKLSGKNYHPDSIKKILTALGFEIAKEGMDEMWVLVPFNKPDISLAADLVEEIIRIDGIDNIEIPSSVTISPQTKNNSREALKEKMSMLMAGMGFHEIINNSITNSKYYNVELLDVAVKMVNNLSADLDVMRPSMLEAGLESIAWNLNRKSNNIQFFEFGKIYKTSKPGVYKEEEQFCFWVTGNTQVDGWRSKGEKHSFYSTKTILLKLLASCGISDLNFTNNENTYQGNVFTFSKNKINLGSLIIVDKKHLTQFDIKQDVFFISIAFATLYHMILSSKTVYSEVPKYPAVQRDLSIVVDQGVEFAELEKTLNAISITNLSSYRLFDLFESEKLGVGKKSFAINFTFSNSEKTQTDDEIDSMMKKIIKVLENNILAEIRK